MASRTVLARLVIDGVQGVVTGFQAAGKAAVEYGNVSQKAGATAVRWVDKHHRDLDKVGGSLLKMGAVGALALGGLAKSAVDWESAWAGVTKTVDGTPDQLAALEQGLRDMSKVLPASHDEIAAVAEAAGQLGVKIDDVQGFTKVMIDLGETTNLTAEEASTSLAQLMNVMGTSQKDVSRLGSTIVALGNNGASTEKDIVSMGQRIAAAGNQVGMSEQDVLAFASALSSTGIEAEAGGTAVSKTFRQIDAAVREGGAGLELIARTSGVTSKEFSANWRDDAAGAVNTFIEGLGGMQARGEDVNTVLKDLGMTGERQADSMLRLAGATKNAGTEQDLLREALVLSKSSWTENNALQAEAEKRYETRAAQSQMAINSIKDEAITLGQSLLPALDSILSAVTAVTEIFGGMPGPVKDAGVQIALVGTIGALAAGGVIKLVVGLNAAKTALAGLGITVRSATIAMGAVGLAIAAAGTILSLFMGRQAEAKGKVDAYTDAIREQNGVMGESTRTRAAQNLMDAGALDMAKSLGVALSDVTDAALGNEDAYRRVTSATATEMAALNDSIAAKALAGEYVGDLTERQRELAGAQMELTSAVDDERTAMSGAIENSRAMAEATEDTTESTEESADASMEDAKQKQAQAEAIQQAAEASRALIEETFAMANALLQLSGSEIGTESAIASLSDTLKANTKEFGKNAGGLNLQTEAGRENQKALDATAASSIAYAETLFKQGASADEIAAATKRSRDAWVETRVAMGGARDESVVLADALFAIPQNVVPTVALKGAITSKKEADDLNAALLEIDPEYRADIVTIAHNEGAVAAKAAIAAVKGKTVPIDADGSGAIAEARRVVNSINSMTGTITIRRTVVGGGRGIEIPQAQGSVLDFHANGAIRENHVAQIAPAGARRVWAEDETGGEAYIPLAASKRRRSLDIWEETGRRLGVFRQAVGSVSASGGSSRMSGIDPSTISAAVAAGMANARIFMDGKEINARIETSLSRTARQVTRGAK